MRFSIAICTWNRASCLQMTLESLTKLRGIQQDDVQVVVVDNNSTDATSAILQSFVDRLPLTVVHERQQGHCYARNAAVAASTGEFLLWTDDDVTLDQQWLEAYRQQILGQADCGFWGGPIIARFTNRPPRWLTANWSDLKGCYAERDLGDRVQSLDASCLPYGANFAVRRELAVQFPFDVELGRRGGALMGEDEVDFFRRLLAAGVGGAWVPRAKLHHLIPADRLTPDYLTRYFAGQAALQFRKGLSPKMSLPELEQAAAYHDFWLRWTAYGFPSRVWLNHLKKRAMFQQWIADVGDDRH